MIPEDRLIAYLDGDAWFRGIISASFVESTLKVSPKRNVNSLKIIPALVTLLPSIFIFSITN